MAARAGVFLMVILFSIPGDLEHPRELVVWNVGQGQWVTIVTADACWHFDVGGEFAPWTRVRRTCGNRPNRVTLSHWDLDHVGFIAKLAQALPGTCLVARPVGPAKIGKTRLLVGIPSCPEQKPFPTWLNIDAAESNARSRVSFWQSVLIPGDATSKEERAFVPAFRGLASARWLVLGHHGSRTATSEALLDALPALRGAVASARRRRYGHPHGDVRRALAAHHVPLITTEDWGDVHVAL